MSPGIPEGKLGSESRHCSETAAGLLLGNGLLPIKDGNDSIGACQWWEKSGQVHTFSSHYNATACDSSIFRLGRRNVW
jgi:hypothetical protein